ncbi:MAG: DUF418 domain-containing protein [Woeseia sp.]|jgi:uncharacterized protein|nr:DUF418 domain-containing protein [Woeseia sp.]MBT6210668.1 DUF418 domain-containing protein [Woeseia sp.]
MSVSSTSELTQSSTSPAMGSERLIAIDTLRGVAVLGILVMNIYAFAMPFVAYQNPLAHGGNEWYNVGTWFLTHIFFDQKFMTIFSLLFGAGLVMMATRADVRGEKYGGLWYRRCFWLMVVGALHGYFIWFGDILFHYGLMGMFIFLFRNCSARSLIITGCSLLLVGVLFTVSGGPYMEDLKSRSVEIEQFQDAGQALTPEQTETLEEWEGMALLLKLAAEQVREDMAAYTAGYSKNFEQRIPIVQMLQTQGTVGFVIWRVGGLMLIGMALMKLGIISCERSNSFYRKLMFIGYGLGLPIMLISAYGMSSHQWDAFWMFGLGGFPNYIGSILVAFGHIALVMTIVKNGILRNLMARFTAVGRMAFTNYLAHSIVMTTIFYGYGFGLYGQIPRIWQMAFVAAMLTFQLWFSPWWLERNRFGPAEWVWRSLSYWKRQPMAKT